MYILEQKQSLNTVPDWISASTLILVQLNLVNEPYGSISDKPSSAKNFRGGTFPQLFEIKILEFELELDVMLIVFNLILQFFDKSHDARWKYETPSSFGN